MSDLIIDGNKLMMGLSDWWYSSFGQEETEEAKAIRIVMNQVEKSLDYYKIDLLSVQPEVIHCSDCIHAVEDALCGGYWCKGKVVTGYHYCGYAERRVDAETL